jgi:hypothetical protein
MTSFVIQDVDARQRRQAYAVRVTLDCVPGMAINMYQSGGLRDIYSAGFAAALAASLALSAAAFFSTQRTDQMEPS